MQISIEEIKEARIRLHSSYEEAYRTVKKEKLLAQLDIANMTRLASDYNELFSMLIEEVCK